MKINTTHLLIAGIAVGAYFLLKSKKETTSNPYNIPQGEPTNQPTVTNMDPNYKSIEVSVGNLC